MNSPTTRLDRAFHALADATRRDVVARLGDGPASVGELAQAHDMALPSFLKHIGVLEEAGLIRTQKLGRVRMCEVNRVEFDRVRSWLDEQRIVWEGRTDRLQALVEGR
ncbi:MAG TPA: metalloregulator ArsR/SmtB family transcription factor [Devosia sp.]